ncbi:cyclic nucleotide-binding domain-containing protein [Kaistia dalseonensis]|uniref:CRP-like cAMP-binding protein n=1 Tax=Kaistia dalseonensis TaxID=410840 RepID=A0ABU0HFA9_9HYPH|nr:cyclic nucleotide-binding domain-containing protein [Kaistia dalseonensis]MCX5497561.1 cyclic nucleotide-binding domain-containing protein [Kaistia dalseonensis]MDQ0440201.1 CRP-like cAMP-binding protein [Kaistia dalseonensis]
MEARDVLERIDLFKQVLTARQLDDLAAKSRIVEMPEGMVLMAEGDFGSSMFAIISGALDVTVAGARHGSRAVAHLGPGDIVGEMSLMTGARRTATVVSAEPTRVLEITKVALEGLITRAPDLLDQLGVVLAQRRAELDRIADDEHATRVLGVRTDEIIHAMRRFFSRAG